MRSRPTSEDGRSQPDQRLRRGHRLLRRHQYQRVQRQGRKRSTRSLLVLYLKNDLGHSRLGIATSRRFGKAVRRNRFRRVVKEVFRRNRNLFPNGHDLVVIPKKGIPLPGYHDLVRQLQGLFRSGN